MSTPSDKTLVIIPTYNEKDNLPVLLDRVLEAEPERVTVLVVDDNSPDGTGDLADERAAKDDRVKVLHREAKNGLFEAYVAGFNWGLERDYTVLCEMDADGSHAPEELYRLLDSIDDGADVVIGSRYVAGGETVNWPWQRLLLSRAGNAYINVLLGAGIHDITAGYRAYRREVLEDLDLDKISRKGYIFQTHIAWKCVQHEWDVREVPITFAERQYGQSKLSGNFISDSLLEVTKWGAAHRAKQAKEIAKVSQRLVGHEISTRVERMIGQR